MLCLPSLSFASDLCKTTTSDQSVEDQLEIKTDVPSHLKGATICVKQADGKESCVPAEKFKVVARKQQFIVTKVKTTDTTTCTVFEKADKEEKEKNRISLLAGNGPKEGLERTNSGSKVTVESRVGVIGGVQYQRLLTERVSVGAQLQSNESALVNIGLDF